MSEQEISADTLTDEAHGHSGTDGDHHDGPHVMSLTMLFSVFTALIALTLLTVGAAQISFGAWEVWVSLGIATFKAALVALYFMHLRYDKPFNAIVFVSSLAFVGLFLAITLIDQPL